MTLPAAWNWDPFRELTALHRDLTRVLDSDGYGRWTFPFSRVAFLPGRAARAYPLVNISEDKDNLYIEALAPGVDPKSLDVSVLNNQLSISGEKRSLGNAGEPVKPEAFHREERALGRFVRTFKLPAEIDAAKIEAKYHDGLLILTLPKAEASKPKQISVNFN